MSIDLGGYIENVATRLLGDPNRALSTRSQLRFGTNGSIAVEIAGDKRGSWFDHENGEGGGPLDLIRVRLGLVNSAAFEWLHRELGIGDGPRKSNGKDRIGDFECAYDYQDEQGQPLFQVVRFKNPKTFRQRRFVDDHWDWSVRGTRQVLYRLKELVATPVEKTVFIAEGEKDVNNLISLGLTATCNPGGAVKRGEDGRPGRQKWRTEYNAFFAGRDAVILPDNDIAGRDLADVIAVNLRNVAARVRILNLPGLGDKGDVTDWLRAGGTSEKLRALIDEIGQNQAAAIGNWYSRCMSGRDGRTLCNVANSLLALREEPACRGMFCHNGMLDQSLMTRPKPPVHNKGSNSC